MHRPWPPEPALLLVFPQWQGAGALPGLRDSSLAVAGAISGPWRRVEVPVEASHSLSRERGIEGRSELLAQLVRARELLEAERPARVLAVGGDCGIEVPVISYLNARSEGQLTVLWLDAHPDLNTPESSPSGHFHGMPLRVLLGEGDAAFTELVDRPLRSDQIALVGTRSLDPGEQELVETRGVQVFAPGEIGSRAANLVRWIRMAGAGRAYVHVDLDVCEPTEVPTVASPTPGGVSVRTLVELLTTLRREITVVGSGLTEALFEGSSVPPALRTILDCFEQL